MGLSLPIWVVINQNWAVIKAVNKLNCYYDSYCVHFFSVTKLINNYVLQLLLINNLIKSVLLNT